MAKDKISLKPMSINATLAKRKTLIQKLLKFPFRETCGYRTQRSQSDNEEKQKNHFTGGIGR